MNKIVDSVAALARPEIEKLGCELWDVEYVKEAGQRFLRIYIDRESGISIDDCEAVSRAVDPLLDAADLIAESYTFEVSSAGAERALKRPSDFERFLGSSVSVKLYAPIEGRKEYVGILKAYSGGDVTVSCAGKERIFKKAEVGGVRLHIDF